MEICKREIRVQVKKRRIDAWLVFLAVPLTLFFARDAFADTLATKLQQCATEQDKEKRLQCYDSLFERPAEPVAADVRVETVTKSVGPAASEAPALQPSTSATPSHRVSMMEKRWDLDPESRKNAPIVEWHNPNYFLFGAFNNTPNKSTMLDTDPEAHSQKTEAVFQLSGKMRPLPDNFLGDKFDFWVGYTQLSFWQVYNSAFSSPFRDTNYAPEAFFTYRTDYDVLNLDFLNLRIVNFGFIHQSNGRSRPLSRSWNRLFAEFGFEKVFEKDPAKNRNEFDLFVKMWYRLPEDRQDDDNPDIENYMGHGEIQGIYYWKDYRFGLLFRNNLRGDNKGAVQFDLSVPLSIFSDKVSWYVQYFNGYGESLLDYNSSSNRIGMGVMVTDWDM